jgi:phenylalanyl-tRNA synthetase alpha chain
LPENPVGSTLAELRKPFDAHTAVDLPEVIDLDKAEARLGGDAVYIDRNSLHRLDAERVLRYDLSLPMILHARWQGSPLRLMAAGKVYRRESESATHLEAFHQAEVLSITDRASGEWWNFSGRVLASIECALPGSDVRLIPVQYPMCTRAWSIDVWRDERWIELMAYGEYAAWVVRAMGADPERHIACGAGYGLERIAALRYHIDDIRKIAAVRGA